MNKRTYWVFATCVLIPTALAFQLGRYNCQHRWLGRCGFPNCTLQRSVYVLPESPWSYRPSIWLFLFSMLAQSFLKNVIKKKKRVEKMPTKSFLIRTLGELHKHTVINNLQCCMLVYWFLFLLLFNSVLF